LLPRFSILGSELFSLSAHSSDPLLRLTDLGHRGQVLVAIPDAVDKRYPAGLRDGVDERFALLILCQLEVHASDAVEQLLDQRAVLLALLDTLLNLLEAGQQTAADRIHYVVGVA